MDHTSKTIIVYLKEVITTISGGNRQTKTDRSSRYVEVTRWSPHIIEKSGYGIK